MDLRDENATVANVEVCSISKSDLDTLLRILKILYGHDCTDIAWGLLRRFGSFSRIFRASREELISVDGMNDRTATFFATILPAYKQALIRKVDGESLHSEAASARLVLSRYLDDRSYAERCVFLNSNGRIVAETTREVGDSAERIVGEACAVKAAGVVIMRGRQTVAALTPSARRLEYLLSVIRPLEMLGIEVYDCFEYCPYKLSSLRRLVSGGECIFDPDDADPSPYERISFTRSLELYLNARELDSIKSHSIPQGIYARNRARSKD